MAQRLEEMVHATSEDAIRALEAVGGVRVPELDLEVEVPGIGVLRRHFAYYGNTVGRDDLAEPRVHRRIMELLESPDNARVARKLYSETLGYTPLNKRSAQGLVPDLHAARVHLPWAFRPMNFDFGAKLESLAESAPVPFRVFYSQGIEIEPDGTFHVKRVFSLPCQGSAHGTFREPVFDELLDEDVGLFIEANAKA